MSKKPLIKIKGAVQDLKKKEKNKKPLNSNFLLTINTNQQYKDNDDGLDNDIEVFEHTIQTILNNIDQYVSLAEGDKWDDDTIKDVDIDYTIERGTIKNQLHIHILFKFKHFTKIQLNYQKIKEKIKKDLGLNNIYLYNRLVRNNGSDNILSYLDKYK
jgi:hypothetical protein